MSNNFVCIFTVLQPPCSPFSLLSDDPTTKEFHSVVAELCSFYWPLRASETNIGPCRTILHAFSRFYHHLARLFRHFRTIHQSKNFVQYLWTYRHFTDRFWQQKPTLGDVERFHVYCHGSATVLLAFFTAFKRSNNRRILSSSCRAIIILLTTSNIRSQHRPISNDFVRISTVLPPSCSHFSLLLDDPTIKEFHAVFVELSSVYWLLLTSETNIGRSQMIVHAFPQFYHHPARPSLRFQTIQQLTNFIQWLQRYSHFTVWGQFDSYLNSLVCRPSTFAIYMKPFFITLIWHLDHSIWSSGCGDIHIFVKISIFNLSLWLGVILMWI